MLVDTSVSSQFFYHRVPSYNKKCWNYRSTELHHNISLFAWVLGIDFRSSDLPINLLSCFLYIFELCCFFCSLAIWFIYKSWILITCKIYSCKNFSILCIIFLKCNCHNVCAHLWGTVQGFNTYIHYIIVKSGFLTYPFNHVTLLCGKNIQNFFQNRHGDFYL